LKFNWEARIAREVAELNALPGIRVTRRRLIRMAVGGAVGVAAGCDAGGGVSKTISDLGTTPDAGTGADEPDIAAGGTAAPDTFEDVTAPSVDEGPPVEDIPEPPPPEPITLQELLDAVHPMAAALVAQRNPNELPYLDEVESLLQLLEITLEPLGTPTYDLETLAAKGPVEIVELEMAPNAVIPLHDHRDYTGALLGVHGSAKVVSYTLAEKQDDGPGFLLHKDADVEMGVGATGTLGLTLRNFHILTAGPEGARFVDVFTFFPGTGYSYFAQLEPEPVDAENDIWRAHWT